MNIFLPRSTVLFTWGKMSWHELRRNDEIRCWTLEVPRYLAGFRLPFLDEANEATNFISLSVNILRILLSKFMRLDVYEAKSRGFDTWYLTRNIATRCVLRVSKAVFMATWINLKKDVYSLRQFELLSITEFAAPRRQLNKVYCNLRMTAGGKNIYGNKASTWNWMSLVNRSHLMLQLIFLRRNVINCIR